MERWKIHVSDRHWEQGRRASLQCLVMTTVLSARLCSAPTLAPAPCPGAKPTMQHLAYAWPMLGPGDQPWECGLLLFSKSAKGEGEENIINVKTFLLVTLRGYKQRCPPENLKIYLKSSIQNRTAWKPVCQKICLRVIKIKFKKTPTDLFTPSCRQKGNPDIWIHIQTFALLHVLRVSKRHRSICKYCGCDLKECLAFV